VDFVHRICEEIFSNPGIRKMKYVNRLTPMTSIGKATEKGLEEVGKDVLGTHFNLAGEDIKTSGEHKPSHTVS
jgi:tRNA acetyltransferase TAN1